MRKDYIIAVQAPAYPISPGEFATESAFAVHLRELAVSIGPGFDRVVLIAPQLSRDEFEARRKQLGTVRLDQDRVAFLPGHETTTSAKAFWLRQAWPLWRRIRAAVKTASVVHSGVADDIWRPMMALVNLAAWWAGKPLVFVVDIDFRQNSRRYYQLGLWSRRSYWLNRLIYDPIVWLQVWAAPWMARLVLLKSAAMVDDFGRGRPHVRNFFDTVHSAQDILTDEEAKHRLAWMSATDGPLQVVYFGRLVGYKGLDRALDAICQARQAGADVHLTLIGDGECREELRLQADRLGISPHVTFHPPVPYGAELFRLLQCAHLAIATPLVEDTPRAAFDAMARGLPILAFDIAYFRDLARLSGAVRLASWPSAPSLAQGLVELSRQREQLAGMAEHGLAFAAANTQSHWLAQRAAWVREVAA